MQLYKSLILPTLLYGSEVWSANQFDILEKGQTNFFKRILGWQRTTPNYIVRREANLSKIEVIAFKNMLNWWEKVLKSSDYRYIRICYNRLMELNRIKRDAKWEANQIKYNWARSMQTTLQRLNFHGVWEEQNFLTVRDKTERIISAYNDYLRESDTQRIYDSTYNVYYKNYTTANQYLELDIHHRVLSLIGQLRTANSIKAQIYHEGTCFKFNGEAVCTLCNTYEQDNLAHFLYHCPIFLPIREQYLSDFANCITSESLLVNMSEKETIFKIFNYVSTSLKLRAFILNE